MTDASDKVQRTIARFERITRQIDERQGPVREAARRERQRLNSDLARRFARVGVAIGVISLVTIAIGLFIPIGMFGFLAAYLVLLLVLGMLLDSTSIMLIMLPLALPVAVALGANLVWFGIVTTIAIEIGLLTPPFGLSVYVIKASLGDDSMSLATIFRGAFPFVLITLAVTILLMVFPEISLALL